MTYLKQRIYRQALVQFCSEPGECEVGKENISLHLSRYAINCARITEAQCFSPLSVRSVGVQYAIHDAVCSRRR